MSCATLAVQEIAKTLSRDAVVLVVLYYGTERTSTNRYATLFNYVLTNFPLTVSKTPLTHDVPNTNYKGYFEAKSYDKEVLTGGPETVGDQVVCRTFCNDKKNGGQFKYFSIEGTTCRCGKFISSWRLQKLGECDTACTGVGKTTQECGGTGHISLWKNRKACLPSMLVVQCFPLTLSLAPRQEAHLAPEPPAFGPRRCCRPSPLVDGRRAQLQARQAPQAPLRVQGQAVRSG
ncbi:hypothetical protein K458DRAFT_406679 [Lentithecium fluviatile CBS 122367]|uniref:WSC domain-containing protein n=1 Tax=Lentithecium fluviatile CBS 122367 TaxID=1168545 RepID=A0A6G1ISV6_9PLEO|nr:hypothetical protein K458DRAFT_406679 [Lentithecium fluviatile CBS 122367]